MLKKVLDLIGWLGTALVFAAVAVRFLKPEWQQVWNGLALGGLACVLLYVLSQWRDVARMFAGRQARLSTLAGASVLIALGILIAINYVASRQYKRWDLTAAKQFALSDQTRKVLQNLKEPVRIRVFGREEDLARFRDRLNEFEYETKQVSIEYLDADRNPALVRQLQVQVYGTAVLEYGGRIERVTSDAEQDLTNALIKVVEGQQKRVYFVQGHGERDPVSADVRVGYNAITDSLKRDNFAVESVVLAQKGDVPADASLAVIAGPTADYLPGEIDALRRYLNKGGRVLMLIDPPDRSDSPPLTNLLALAQEWGFTLGNDLVLDEVGQLIGTGASAPVAASFPSHPITDNFRVLTAFPLARSVAPAKSDEGATRVPQTIVESSAQSFAKTDVSALRQGGTIEMNEAAGDRRGPISLAAALSVDAPEQPAKPDAVPAKDQQEAPAEDRKLQTRIVVYGDSDFGSNGALGIPGNRDLFLNTINWLAERENLISIRPREPEDRRITMTADQQRRIFWLSVLFIPGLVIGTGVYAWWRRR